MTGVYAEGVVGYAQAGWPCIIPVPPLDKFPPPVGYTGAAGRDTDPLQLVEFATTHAGYSIALRMPDGVIGIDVDHYDKAVEQPDGSTKTVSKRGADTLAAYEAKWGALPPTWSSTARGTTEGPGPSRILFYRVPPQRYGTKLDGDVEIIQRHHRYAVVAPSTNTHAGAQYRWYDPAGLVSEQPPKPIELPELPAGWVTGLLENATDQGPAASDPMAGQHLLDQLVVDDRDECAEITNARLLALELAGRADAGSRHDTMTARIHHLVQLAAHGHTGVAAAIADLHALWLHQTAGEDRGPEFGQMLRTSARKAVTLVGANQVPRDPCVLDRGFSVPPPMPVDNRPDDPDNEVLTEPMRAPRWWSIREVIGAAAFDPSSDLDQTLGQAVLDRMLPELRYAYDTSNWLLRLPDRWELHGDLSGWAVAELGWLMPQGDADKEASNEEKSRASRRARLLSHKGASAIASKIKVLVASGAHPSAIRLGDLDTEPDVMWAGGLPYDLRASHEAPQLARIDPSTPHLHTTAVAPERRPTPLWDAFLASVWPDPEIRAWAMRVLSITLTGYSDRALPILLGEKGRGKTQVVNLVMSVLGSYAHAANPKLLGATDSHDTIIFDLRGRRLSFIDEGPREGRLGQERLKQLTGGGELTANQMRQDAITFRPTHTLVLTANDEPILTDPAIRDRVRLIPCDGDPEAVGATRAAIGHVNSRAWQQEAPGVLALLMAEAAGWLSDRHSAMTAAAPESIRWLAETVGAEQDPIRVWVEDEMEPWDTGTGSRELYQLFRASCQRSGMRADLTPSETKWGRELTRLGYPSVHTNQGKRRSLRPRSMWAPSPQPSPQQSAVTGYDGLVTGSQTNPSPINAQVRPTFRAESDGLTGSTALLAPHAQAPAPAHTHVSDEAESTRQPVTEEPNSGSDLRKHPDPNPSQGASTRQEALPGLEPAAAKPSTKDEFTRLAKAAERARILDEAAGDLVEFPTLVTRGPGGTAGVVAVGLADADLLLDTITATDAPLTVDIENTGYPVGHQHYGLRTVQLGDEAFSVNFDPTDPEQDACIRKHLAAATWLHAHSSTADGVPLTVAGLVDWDSFWDRMHDTVIPAKLADPQLTGSDPGLKEISAAVLGTEAVSTAALEGRKRLFTAGKWLMDTEPTTPLERSGWAQVDSRCTTMQRYAGADVLDTAAIARRLPPIPDNILARERLAQRMTARIALDGLPLDADHVDTKHAEHTQAKGELSTQLRDHYTIDNPGSAKQIVEKLTEMGVGLPKTKPSKKYPEGQPSVAAGVLEQIKNQPGLRTEAFELITTVLDYRHHATALSLFLETFHNLVHRGDGRIRSTIYTLGTDTGRMSSVRFNLQQLSRVGGIRACITADPGHKLISADFSGVEFRVAAALSQDPNLIRMLLEGVDMHTVAAQQVYGPEATKGDRYNVKRGNFGWLYGGRAPTLAKQMGVPIHVAQQLIDTLNHLLPGVTAWSEGVKAGLEFGHITYEAYSGRVIHLPVSAPHAAPNYEIQGTARELLVDGQIRWDSTPWGRSIMFPVHDEVVAMVPENEADDATAALSGCMASELYGVPIVADPSTPSFAWQDAA
ncbi:DNA polymerase [Kribbella sp. NPDC051718]|uniref:DNA polymerase n=1 Tax=Kribbella sp. NPDC051718 TaxID=3155168 RepID=UPI00342D8006